MIHQISGTVYRLIREYGGLTPENVAAAIGRKRQTIWRLEKNQNQMLLKRSHEDILVEKAKLTRPAFGEIMCEALTPFVGRRILMAPSDHFIPSRPLSRALKLYSLHQDKLKPEVQQIIDEMLNEGRSIDAGAERTCRLFEKEIVRLINEAREARGEDPSSDDED